MVHIVGFAQGEKQLLVRDDRFIIQVCFKLLDMPLIQDLHSCLRKREILNIASNLSDKWNFMNR